ncbi:MAG: MEDS domain-containing protein [Thermodesulfobacteriota bacterium]
MPKTAPALASNHLIPGNHACFFYESERGQQQLLGEFSRQGMKHQEKVVYLADPLVLETFLNFLKNDGLKIETSWFPGQMPPLTSGNLPAKAAGSDPDRLVQLLWAETEKAVAEGYSALRVALEMKWLLPGLPDFQQLLKIESRLGDFSLGSKCSILCLYDQRQFPPATLLEVLSLHPLVMVGNKIYDNIFYLNPADYLDSERETAKLQRGLARIVEHRQGWEALLRSQQKYRHIIENLSDMVFTVNQEGQFTYLSPRAEELTGKSLQQLYQMNCCDLVAPESLTSVLREIARLKLGETSSTLEVELLSAGDQRLPVELSLSLIPDALEGADGILGEVAPANGKKQLIESLRQESERHETVLDGIPVATFMIDRSRRVLLWNRACEALTGISRQAACGRPVDLSSLYKESQPSILAELILEMPVEEILKRHIWEGIRKADSYPEALEATGRIWTKDKERLVHVLATRVRDAAGEVIGAVQCFQDITEREELHKQLLHAQKMQAMGTLAAGMAHEFNNILSVIQSAAQMISLGQKSDHPQAGFVQEIETACQRASGLIRRILTFSRLDEGEKVPVKINKLVEKIGDLLRQTLPPMIEVEVDLKEGLPFIMGVIDQLEQVLLNMGLNSRDAMPQGGKITLTTCLAEFDRAFRRIHPFIKGGRYLEVRVEDTGQGMPPEIVKQVFDPFFTTKETGQGTGLGLSIAYSIVKNHGGYILVESQVGRGSKFRLLFPIVKGTVEEKMEPQVGKIMSQGKGERVLLVDDEPQLREIIGKLLTIHGYQVILAANGEEALNLFKQTKEKGETPQLVILDMAMPVMDGRACLQGLMEIEPQTRVLFATGLVDEKINQELLDLNVRGVLQKPFNLQTLLENIRNALDDLSCLNMQPELAMGRIGLDNHRR